MRSVLRRLDETLIRLVSKLSAGFKVPFVWLGRFTTPVLWTAYVIALQIVLITPGDVQGEAIAVVIAMPLASVLKLFIRRKRPPTIYAQSMKIKSYSFPSSHAYAGLLSTMWAANQITIHTNLWIVGMLAIAFGGVIGISRVRVGAHYPTDVLGGWILAVIVYAAIRFSQF